MPERPSEESIVEVLVQQAKVYLGEQRAEENRTSIEGTAHQIADLAENLPQANTEPGCYPTAG